MLVKEIENPFYAEVILGARALISDQGGALFLTSSEGKHEEERRMIDLLRTGGIDGLILAPVLDDRATFAHLFALQQQRFPFVLLGEVKGLPVSMVTVDNVHASRKAVRYLIQNGHTRIIHFAGPRYSAQSQYRIQGFWRGFSETHLKCEDSFIVPAGDHLEDGYQAALAVFRDRKPEERPTAVTCFNDLIALGVMRALYELGIGIPDDVSVVGYDDIQIGRYIAAPLTTVRTPSNEMGRSAAALLLRQIENPGEAKPERAIIEAELVVRKSTRSLLTTDEEPVS